MTESESVRVQISKKRHSHTRRCSWHSRDQTVWTRIYLWRPGGSLHGPKTLVIPVQICGYDSQVCEAMVTKNVLDIMYPAHSPRITRWNHDILDPDQMEMYAAAITSRGAPLQNCFGFLDGTVRPIALSTFSTDLLCIQRENNKNNCVLLWNRESKACDCFCCWFKSIIIICCCSCCSSEHSREHLILLLILFSLPLWHTIVLFLSHLQLLFS